MHHNTLETGLTINVEIDRVIATASYYTNSRIPFGVRSQGTCIFPEVGDHAAKAKGLLDSLECSHVDFVVKEMDDRNYVVGFWRICLQHRLSSTSRHQSGFAHVSSLDSSKEPLDTSQLGQQAAASGYQSALANDLKAYTSVADGIPFRIYIDRRTGIVTNFHSK